MNNNWYYSETGEQSHGPISIEDLGRILSSESNSANFLVWCPGMQDWARAGNTAALRRYFQQHTPPPLRVSSSDAIVTVPVKSATFPNLHPWRRYFARMIDLYLFFLIFFLFLGITAPELFAVNQTNLNTRNNEYIYTFVGLAAYAIFETFCLNIFGGTFGKTLYGIRLVPKDQNIAFAVALKRSLAVWVRGMGLGIPVVTLVTTIVAYRALLKERQTSWDRDFRFTVQHRDLSIFRWLVVALAWLLLLSIALLLIASST